MSSGRWIDMLDMVLTMRDINAMKLDAYIRTNNVTEVELAEKAGCSQPAINRVRNNQGNPTFDLLRRISRATGGVFTPSDFDPPDDVAPALVADEQKQG